MESLKKTYQLNDGNTIPMVGFGTWQAADGKEAEESVLHALKVGYRHIDTAAVYKNEESVGRAIKRSGINRDELFITTKLWNDNHSYEGAKKAINESLNKLGLDYVDLYLIHWPNPLAIRGEYAKANAESWRAMEEAVAEGKIKSIGVSNFLPHHLDELLKTAKIRPAVNQIFLNPSDAQPEIVEYCQNHNLLLEAYSPLGTGKIFDIPELQNLAKSYQKSVAQIVLRWSIQHGFLPLPKSVTAERIAENANIFDFELTNEDMKIIDNFHGKAGLAANPDEVEF